MSRWKSHVQKWKDCQLCTLCEDRTNVVLARGNLPCKVLMVGEAPGPSEDVLGRPFVGPAGKLLDAMINTASGGNPPTICMTNLVCCIPLGDDGNKFREPPVEAIEACSKRLDELVEIAQPEEIIYVGKLAYEHGQYEGTEIVHPAAILRANEAQKSLMIKRTEIALQTVFGRV